MIRRLRDMERAGAEAAAADGPAAEIEAREDMTDAQRSRPRGARRMARAAAAAAAAAAAEEEAAVEAAEAAEGRLLETRNARKVLPPLLPLPTASCASSC